MNGHASLSINRRHIVDNYITLKNLTLGSTAAVVKANAYGTGAELLIPELVEAGAEEFFVAQPSEYAHVARHVPQHARIYVLNGASLLDQDMLRDRRLVPVANNKQEQHLLRSHTGPVAFHIDTAMKRLGFLHDDWGDIPTSPYLLMSHFSCADEDDDITNNQINQFQTALDLIRPERASLANSAGIIHHPASHHDLTRPGIGLYGGMAFDGVKNVLKLSAKILQANRLMPGDQVGYGATFVADMPITAYTLGIGYADGLPRHLSNKAYQASSGLSIMFLGRVSMDSCVIAIQNGAFDEGQWVDLINTPDDLVSLAEKAGTISYELLTGLGNQFRGQRST